MSISQDTPQEPAQASSTPAKVARLRLDRTVADQISPNVSEQLTHWTRLRQLKVDADTIARHHLYVEGGDSDIVARFDFLRTMIGGAMQEHGILRLGVCAPTAGCGASFVATNLALSMARRPSTRVLLADFNLRDPGLARQFGATAPGPLAEVLSGKRPAAEHLRLVEDNLAVMLNSQPVQNSSEILQEPATGLALREIRDHYGPTVEIYDLPPLLGSDQTLSFLPQLDGLLLVADGTITTATDLRQAERLFEGRTRLVGLVLNRGEIRHPLHVTLGNFLGRLFGRHKKV